jgi:hypothetical protein
LQRKKRLSNFALEIPSGLNNSETIETKSAVEASDCIFDDEDRLAGGLMPDAMIFQVETCWILSFLFLVEASSPYANNNVPRRNSLQRIVFYSGQRIVLPTPSGALLDLIMVFSRGP